MENDIQKLYDVLSREGYYTKSFDDFVKQFEDEEYKKKVYGVASRDGLFTKSYEDFSSKYNVKKKDFFASEDATLAPKDTQSQSDQSRSSSESLDASIQSRGLSDPEPQEEDYRLQAAPQFEAQGVDLNEYLSLVDRRGEIEDEMATISEERPPINPFAKTEGIFQASLKDGLTNNQKALEYELQDINRSISKNQEAYDKAIMNYQDDKFKQLQQTSNSNEEFRAAIEAEGIDVSNVRLPELMIDGKSVNLKEWNSWWLNQDNVDLAQDVDKAMTDGNLPEGFTPPITNETIEFLKNSKNPGLQDAYKLAQRQIESNGEWGDMFERLHGGVYNLGAFVSQTLGKLESFVMSPIGDYSNYDRFLEEGSENAMYLSSRAEEILEKTRAYEGGITESFLDGDVSSAFFQMGGGLFETAPTLAAIAASGPAGLTLAGVSAYGGRDLDITKRNAAIRAGEADGELIEGWRRAVSPLVSAAAEVVGEVATLGILNKARAAGGFSKITDPNMIFDSWMKGSAKAFGIEGASEGFTEFMDYAIGDVAVLGDEFSFGELGIRMGDAFAVGSLMGPTMYSGTRALYSLKNMKAGDKATTITVTKDGKDIEMTRAEFLGFAINNLEGLKSRDIKAKFNTSSAGKEFFENVIYNSKVEEAVEAKAIMREKEKAVSEILEKINSSEEVSTEDINALGEAVSQMKVEEKNSVFNRDDGTEQIEKYLEEVLSSKNIQILDPVNTQDRTGSKIKSTEKATEITSVEEYNSILKQLKDGSKRPTIVKGQDNIGIYKDGKYIQQPNVDISRFSSVKNAMNALAEFKAKMEATKNNAVEDPETYTKNNKVFSRVKKESLDEVSKETIDNGDYHIISTGLKGLSKDNINSRDSKLIEEVEALGGKAYKTTTIKDGVEQSSFVIEGLSDAQAMDIANGFQQESIISGKSGKLYSDGTSQEIVGETYKGLKARSRSESTVVNINGRKTSIANAFSSRTVGGKTIDASNVHQLDESSDNYDSAFMESLTEQQREYLGFMTKLMNSIGNLKFTLLSNNEAARRQLEMMGGPVKQGDIGSFVDPKTGEIFLNLETMRGNTLFHEIMHPFVRFAKKNDPKLYQKIKNQVISSKLKKKYVKGGKQVRETYYEWAEKSYEALTKGMTLQKKEDYLVEEAFAEMVGDASWGTFKRQQKPFNQFKSVLRALLGRVFGKKFKKSPESVTLKDMSLNSSLLDRKPGMTETLAGALTQGREIKIGDNTFIVEPGEGDLRFQRDAIDRRTQVQYTYDVNSEKFAEMQQDGTINSGASIKDFEGKTMMVHSPDATFSGNLIDRDGTILIEGKGGLYYTMKFNEQGNFWASTDNAANKMVDQLNSMMDANDGKIFMGLTTAPADKLMSNTAVSRGVMNLFTSQNFINKIALSKPRVYKALIDAANSKNPAGDGLGLNLKPYRARRNFEESVIKDIWSKLDNSESSFQDRKFFTDKFLTNVRGALVSSRSKTNFVNFIKTTMAEESIVRFNKEGSPNIQSMKKALVNVLTEPELRGEEATGKMYAILEIEGPVKALKSDDYESYGTSIVSKNGNRAKIHRLDTREFWYNFTEEPGTNIVIGDRETISKGAAARGSVETTPLRDQIMPMQAGVTMEPVRITTDIKFQAPTYDMEYTPNALVSLNLLSDNNRQPEQWVKEIAKGIKGSSRDADTMGLLEALKSYKEQNNVKSINKATVENIIATNMAQIETVILSGEGRGLDFDEVFNDFNIEVNEDNRLVVYFPDGENWEYSSVDFNDWEGYRATDADVINSALANFGYEDGAVSYSKENPNFDKPQYPDNALDGGINYREFLIKNASPEDIFTAPHYGTQGKNLIVSARVDDRIGPNGEMILFVQEIQSDWVQGVNKDNFATKAELDKLKSDLARVRDISSEIDKIDREIASIQGTVQGSQSQIFIYEDSSGEIKGEYARKNIVVESGFNKRLDEPSKKEIELQKQRDILFKESESIERFGASKIEMRISELRPYLPWNQTDLWVGLTIRKLINQASKEGYNQIAFINGKQSDRVQGHSDGRTAEFYDKIVPKNINKELDRLVKGSKFEVGTLENEGSLYNFRDFEFAMDERSDEFFNKIYTLETSMDRGDQVSLTISYEEEPVNPKTDVIKSYTLSYRDFTRTYQIPYGLKIYDEAVVDIREKIMQDLSRLTSTKSENAVINLTPELKAATDKVGPLRFQVANEDESTIYTSGLASVISDVSYGLQLANHSTGKLLTSVRNKDLRYDISLTELMKKPFGTHSDAEVKEIMRRSTGTVNEQIVIADNLVKRMLRANQESRLPMSEINDLLHDKKKIEALPKGQLRDALIDMRMHIDALSRTLVREGHITGKTAFKITANEGLYIHRSFKTFEAKDPITSPLTGRGFVQKDAGVIDRAEQFVLREWVEKDKRYDNMTDSQKLGAAKQIVKNLQNPKVRDRARSADTGDNPTIVTSIFKQKNEDLPQELVDLWGEVDDPMFNYKETVVNLAKSVAGYRMFEELNELGQGKFVSDVVLDGVGNKLAGEKWGPLSGKYVDNEMYSVLTQANAMIEGGFLVRNYMNGVALFKKFLTVWNPSTHMINLAGNSYFGFINGHISLEKREGNPAMTALKTTAQAVMGFSDMELQGLYQELTKLGVVSSSASLQEIRRISEDLGNYDYNVDEYMQAGMIRELYKGIKKTDQAVQKVYQAEDDVWKIFGFQVEKLRYLEAGLSEVEATKLAAKNIIATYPNYNEIPAALRFISRSPFVGTFVSFQAEAIRCSKNAVKLGFQEMQSDNPEIKKIGATRLASTIASFTVVQSIQLAVGNAILNGLGIGSSADDDDYEEKKQFSLFAPWDRFGNILEWGSYVDDQGRVHVQYMNMSRFSGGGFIKDLIRMGLSDDPIVSERKGFMMYKEMMSTFLGTEITLDIVIDIFKNPGNKVYNPESTEKDQFASTLKYIADRLGPGIYRNINRITQSFDEASKYSTSREISAMFGARVTDVIVDESLYYNASSMFRSIKSLAKGEIIEGFGEKAFDFRDEIEFRKRLDSDSELYSKDLDYLVEQMAQQWAAAQLHGVDPNGVIIPTLNRIGVPKHLVGIIFEKVRNNYVEDVRNVDSRDQTFMETMGVKSNEEDVNKILQVTD